MIETDFIVPYRFNPIDELTQWKSPNIAKLQSIDSYLLESSDTYGYYSMGPNPVTHVHAGMVGTPAVVILSQSYQTLESGYYNMNVSGKDFPSSSYTFYVWFIPHDNSENNNNATLFIVDFNFNIPNINNAQIYGIKMKMNGKYTTGWDGSYYWTKLQIDYLGLKVKYDYIGGLFFCMG